MKVNRILFNVLVNVKLQRRADDLDGTLKASLEAGCHDNRTDVSVTSVVKGGTAGGATTKQKMIDS